MKTKYIYCPLLLFVLIFIAGCVNLRQIDNSAGKLLDKIPQPEEQAGVATTSPAATSTTSTVDLGEATGTPEAATSTFSEILTEAIKNKIDAWLDANKLNRYGDATGTMYTGGTPLFSERTDESIDRFAYILKKIPDLLNKIKD